MRVIRIGGLSPNHRQRIAEYLYNRGWTMERVSVALNVSRQTITPTFVGLTATGGAGLNRLGARPPPRNGAGVVGARHLGSPEPLPWKCYSE
jgi:hypothetical protein